MLRRSSKVGVLLAVAAGLASCGGGSGGGDGSADAGVDAAGPYASSSCLELHQLFLTEVASISTSCTTPSDCVRVGGSGSNYCEGVPQLGTSSSGTPIRATAYLTAPNRRTLQAVVAEFAYRCVGHAELCGSAYCPSDTAMVAVDCVSNVCTNVGSAVCSDAGP